MQECHTSLVSRSTLSVGSAGDASSRAHSSREEGRSALPKWYLGTFLCREAFTHAGNCNTRSAPSSCLHFFS